MAKSRVKNSKLPGHILFHMHIILNLPKLCDFLSFQGPSLQAGALFFNVKCTHMHACIHTLPSFKKLVIWYVLLRLLFWVLWLILYYFEYLKKSLKVYWLLGCTDLGKLSLTSLRGCIVSYWHYLTKLHFSCLPQNHRIIWVGRELQPTSCSKQVW